MLITESNQKLIIVVHLYGMLAKDERNIKISTKYNIPIVEDVAEGLGHLFQ